MHICKKARFYCCTFGTVCRSMWSDGCLVNLSLICCSCKSLEFGSVFKETPVQRSHRLNLLVLVGTCAASFDISCCLCKTGCHLTKNTVMQCNACLSGFSLLVRLFINLWCLQREWFKVEMTRMWDLFIMLSFVFLCSAQVADVSYIFNQQKMTVNHI